MPLQSDAVKQGHDFSEMRCDRCVDRPGATAGPPVQRVALEVRVERLWA